MEKITDSRIVNVQTSLDYVQGWSQRKIILLALLEKGAASAWGRDLPTCPSCPWGPFGTGTGNPPASDTEVRSIKSNMSLATGTWTTTRFLPSKSRGPQRVMNDNSSSRAHSPPPIRVASPKDLS